MFTVTELKNIVALLSQAVVKGTEGAEVLLGIHKKAVAHIATLEAPAIAPEPKA